MDDALTAELAYRRELMDRTRGVATHRTSRPRTPWGRAAARRGARTLDRTRS